MNDPYVITCLSRTQSHLQSFSVGRLVAGFLDGRLVAGFLVGRLVTGFLVGTLVTAFFVGGLVTGFLDGGLVISFLVGALVAGFLVGALVAGFLVGALVAGFLVGAMVLNIGTGTAPSTTRDVANASNATRMRTRDMINVYVSEGSMICFVEVDFVSIQSNLYNQNQGPRSAANDAGPGHGKQLP